MWDYCNALDTLRKKDFVNSNPADSTRVSSEPQNFTYEVNSTPPPFIPWAADGDGFSKQKFEDSNQHLPRASNPEPLLAQTPLAVNADSLRFLQETQPLPDDSNEPVSTGTYKCHHPGCTAPPFQTQYLLV